MQISPEIAAAIIGSTIGASALILIGIIRWLDGRITKIEGNVAKAQNGKLEAFIIKQDRRHRAVCRRQNKFEKIVTGFIAELNAFRAVSVEEKTEKRRGSLVDN